jgi:hypothetical protein
MARILKLAIALSILPLLWTLFVWILDSPNGHIATPSPAAFLAVLLVELVYLLPTVIAFFRGLPNTGSLFVLNLTLGWSLIGWVIFFAMAVRSKPRPVVVVVQQASPTSPRPR